jgi:hypothetical protein
MFQTRTVENIKTHVLCYVTFFPTKKSCPLWDEVQKNIVDPDKPQMTIWRMLIEFWIPVATNTHSEYVVLIAFPLLEWLQERISLLRYTFVITAPNTALGLFRPSV